jgi:hypothetical protein
MSKSHLYQLINQNLALNPSSPAVVEHFLHLRSIVGRMGKHERKHWEEQLRLP